MSNSRKFRAVLGVAIAIGLARLAFAADPSTPVPFWVGVAQAQLAALQSAFDKLGPARIEGGALYFGATKIDGNTAAIEPIARRIGAIWIYRRDGDRFAAIVTNMHDQTGGYDLDRPLVAEAAAALRQGEPYYGAVALAPDLSAKAGYRAVKARDGRVIGAYFVLVSERDACERNLAPVVFPAGPRHLVAIDGDGGFTELGAQIRASACDGVSITWREGCNSAGTSTHIGENGEIIGRIEGGSSTLLGCLGSSETPGQERIVAALRDATHWRIDAQGMLILEGGGHSIVFDRGTRARPEATP